MTSQPSRPTYLTTKEVAELLRVKERKVYDLAASDEIPYRRITGKLLFPTTELIAWIDGSRSLIPTDKPPVLSGSHDPLLDWAVRESACGLATLFNGSLEGIDSFAQGVAGLAALHIHDKNQWNIPAITERQANNAVLIAWAKRSRGWILAPVLKGEVASLEDLRGYRLAMRQPGSGARVLFDAMLAQAGLVLADFSLAASVAHTENEAAAAVAGGEADAALGIEAMARHYQLDFSSLLIEPFDLLIDRRTYFTTPVQTLLEFARGASLKAKAESLGGYDMTDLGNVRWLSP